MMSCPPRATGRVIAWMGKGEWMPASASESTMSWWTPKSAKDWVLICVSSVLSDHDVCGTHHTHHGTAGVAGAIRELGRSEEVFVGDGSHRGFVPLVVTQAFPRSSSGSLYADRAPVSGSSLAAAHRHPVHIGSRGALRCVLRPRRPHYSRGCE